MDEHLMGFSGRVRHSIITPTSSPTSWSVHCNGGVLVRGGTFAGAASHYDCSNVYEHEANFGTRIVTGQNVIEVICAQYGSAWEYASSTGQIELEGDGADTADILDVFVVGAGMGGHAAAASALSQNSQSQIRMVSSGSSTSQRSSGVVWFPINHTVDELMEAYGSDTVDGAHLAHYVATGKESYAFWKSPLNLTVYPSRAGFNSSQDYTNYAAGPKANNSFYMYNCTNPAVKCGGATLNQIKAKFFFGNREVTGRNVTAVTVSRVGYRVETRKLDGTDAQITLARTVVFASGGSAHHDKIYKAEHILAAPENSGIHLMTAAALNMKTTGSNLNWGLEFAKKPNDDWTANWFSFGCGPNINTYEPCADYNARVSTYPTQSAEYSTKHWQVDIHRESCKPSSSFAWWRNFFMPYYMVDPVTVESANCQYSKYAGGVIDGKQGFELNVGTMESTQRQGLYAAGTTAAYVLGNTYFAPGATLGWALHSGRLAGKAAAAKAAEKKLLETRDAQATHNIKLKSATKIWLFRAGAWVLIVAVGAHVDSRVADAVGWARSAHWARIAHYLLAPIGAGLLLWPAIAAWAQPKDDRIMRSSSSSKFALHRRLGYVVVVLLGLQVVLGILARRLNKRNESSAILGVAHRVIGWTILVAATVLYYTSKDAATLHDDNVSKKEHHGQAVAFAALVGISFATVLVLFAQSVARGTSVKDEILGSWRQGTQEKKSEIMEALMMSFF